MKSIDDDIQKYAQEKTKVDDDKGEYHQEAITKLKDYLKGESIQSLKAKARATPGTEDDRMVDRLDEIDASIKSINSLINGRRSDLNNLDTQINGLNEVIQKYTRKDYESGRSRFPSSFDINDFLTGYLTGKVSSGDIWKQIDKHQEFEPQPVYHHSYSSPSSSGSSWSSSSGSSGSSSSDDSFGGGSFSSGGGFGGGGGFSSGSGF